MLKNFNCLKDVRSRFKSRHVNLFLLLSVLCLWLIVPGVVSAQVVDIPDPGLRAAIAQALGKAPGDAITRAEMETLVELRATFRDITDLRGIEFAINLESLYLYNNAITDISPLSSLTNLTRLDIWGNAISDISPLSSLTNLTYLNLGSNTISDIFPLITLTNLERLYLYNNAISDISPLSSLTNLTWLDIWGNAISDISPLSSLTNLTYLNLGSNTISDIFPLITLTNLERLYLYNNAISDISPLSSLTNLTSLYLENNTITDISPLANLTDLTSLGLGDNTISDISPLSSLTNLLFLSLVNNAISDIFPLITLTNLYQLWIYNNNISDIETLERLMAQGTVVYFRGNPAFETPGPKIEDGWVWLIVPALDVFSGNQAASSGRDFLSEVSGGTVTEADVAVNGARVGTRVGYSVWTSARLDARDPNNLNTIAGDHNASSIALPIESETPQEFGDNGWISDGLDATERDKRNALMWDDNLESHIRYPVAYGVARIESETPQDTRVYIGAAPVKVWLNGTLVHKDTSNLFANDYETAVPVTLNAGDNVLFIAAYRPYSWSRWGAFFGFQDGTGYTIGAPSAGSLDVNGDGQVNVLDLVLVAVFYGTRGDGLPADVNADGIVNVQDFAAVAAGVDAAGDASPQMIEEILLAAMEQAADLEDAPAAPMGFGNAHRDTLSGSVATRNVAAALSDARHLVAGDVRLSKGVALLETLLQLLTEMRAIPETTALLPNYPNPFNPETWIPYHLATDAAVVLTIYDVRGSVVRTLTLGHQPAGVYESRGRAAYWDGKNQTGEPVASGVYFYTLTAGEFTATRKLLIAK